MKQDLSGLQQYAAPGTPDLNTIGIEVQGGVIFRIPTTGVDTFLQIAASEMMGWDHLSMLSYYPMRKVGVSGKKGILEFKAKVPTRDEIHRVRSMFFEDTEKVFDLIPPEQFFLDREARKAIHLWSPQGEEWPAKWPWTPEMDEDAIKRAFEKFNEQSENTEPSTD